MIRKASEKDIVEIIKLGSILNTNFSKTYDITVYSTFFQKSTRWTDFFEQSD